MISVDFYNIGCYMETLHAADYVYLASASENMDTEILNVGNDKEELIEVEETEDFVYTDDEDEEDEKKSDQESTELCHKDEDYESEEATPIRFESFSESSIKKSKPVKKRNSGLSRQRAMRRSPRKDPTQSVSMVTASISSGVSSIVTHEEIVTESTILEESNVEVGETSVQMSSVYYSEVRTSEVIGLDQARDVDVSLKESVDEIVEREVTEGATDGDEGRQKLKEIPSIELSEETLQEEEIQDDEDILTAADIERELKLAKKEKKAEGDKENADNLSVSSIEKKDKSWSILKFGKKNKAYSFHSEDGDYEDDAFLTPEEQDNESKKKVKKKVMTEEGERTDSDEEIYTAKEIEMELKLAKKAKKKKSKLLQSESDSLDAMSMTSTSSKKNKVWSFLKFPKKKTAEDESEGRVSNEDVLTERRGSRNTFASASSETQEDGDSVVEAGSSPPGDKHVSWASSFFTAPKSSQSEVRWFDLFFNVLRISFAFCSTSYCCFFK